MLAAFTSLQNAQKVKRFLQQHNALHQEYLPIKELDHIYFPLSKRVKVPSAKVVTTKILFKKRPIKIKIEDLLAQKLTKRQIKLLPRSQELVGKIMILEVPEELAQKGNEKEIAQAYLKLNPHIETVVKKTRMHAGVFRTRKVKILAGKRTKETLHHENGISLLLHLEKTYFSARSASERLRVAKLVKPKELVLVMFSGAAPYPLVIAKNSLAKQVYGIELNPLAHQFAVENVGRNGLTKRVVLFEGDAHMVSEKIRKKFDRVVMPLPKTGEDFLDAALRKIRKGGMIHLYAFLNENEIQNYAKHVRKSCSDMGFSVRILRKVKCGQFSPGTFRVCLDIKVLS